MTSIFLIGLSISIFGLVLAWAFFRTAGQTTLKLGLTVLFMFLATTIALSFNSYLGYPSKEKITGDSDLLGVVIQEPEDHTPGAIYVWVMQQNVKKPAWAVFVYDNAEKAPRVFFLPYTKDLQKQMKKALEALQAGYSVKLSGVEVEQGKDEGDFAEGEVTNAPSGTKGLNTGDRGYESKNALGIEVIDPRKNNRTKK